jgi:hypothetical protein
MYLILFILGVMVTLAGGAMLAFGASNNGFDLGNTLIIAGTTAFVGGLALIALAEAVRQLRRIAESLMARPFGRMPRANEAFDSATGDAPPVAPRIPFPPKPEPRHRAPAPALQPESRLDLVPSLDAAEERQEDAPPVFAHRRAPEPRVIPEHDEAPLSPKAEPRFTAAREPKDELSEGLLATAFSRLDISLRPSAAPAAESDEQQQQQQQQQPFESVWPSEPKAADAEPTQAEGESPEAEAARDEPPEAEEPKQPEQPEEPYAVSILKSGVVDGMAYTLYSDGSIEAEMPQGTMRFASITELRDYLEKSSS